MYQLVNKRYPKVSIRTASYKQQGSNERRTKISNTRCTAYDNKGVARLSRLKENNRACPTYQVCIM
jgi:hypothetical protein